MLVKLRFRAPLHIGSSTLGEEDTHDFAPSDTLFSAICHAYLAAFGKDELEELLARFDDEPPFRISSAFPYHGDTLFLPPPRIAPPENGGESRKKRKGSAWLPSDVFSKLLGGEDVGDVGDFADRLPRKELLPRVALDRESSASQIYHVRRTVFPEGGGLWMLVDVEDERMEARLRRSLHLLGDMGVGGERTMGCGFFEPEFEEAPPDVRGLLGGKAPYIAISRVSPEDGEMGMVDRYTLVESRGWMASPTGTQRKRKSVWFFAEGSSFEERPTGRLLDVTPDDGPGHSVYRYGYGMYLGRAR